MIDILRESTSQLHQSLESQLGGFTSVNTVARYRALLRCYRALFGDLRTEWQRHPIALDWSPNLDQRIADLDTDLSQLPSVPAHPTGDEAFSLPRLDAVGLRAGCLYVVEGSALGGLMLARDFATRIPELTDDSLHFFQGAGPAATSRRWRAFMAWLASREWTTPETTAATNCATATFAYFSARLSPAMPNESACA
ncbi:biliverdin-producing heme oxygenase [Synoicihabitans lomoniglobus]|uniref:Biliverdin-producing heme oxygenase n=1 Tax=Synoicihabitans lomoniglobus TaxID=2909285 RepID=A0AAE9ZT44_9BACT|nr:biliverdin-producing heme oxygenase [Opitutaceae bacterium LMO-M01]WED64710.1 biliverdin-producing heme oxygenase [Opitutaceae bacterium LMO-M01]